MGRLREYTRIKHTVLMDIFAKGRLSKRELQIACAVIRESWGWDGGQSNWTKHRVSHSHLAKLTGMDRRHLVKTTRNMLEQKILLKNNEGQLSFNEHTETWVCQKGTDKPCTKKAQVTVPKGHRGVYQKGTGGCAKKAHLRILGTPALSYSLKALRELTKLPKERFKERFKETLKEMVSFLRNYYQIKMNRKLRVFGKTREKMILNRLENFSLNELMEVVTNISKSDWHMEKKQNTFELLFRNDVQVEKYLALEPRIEGRESNICPACHKLMADCFDHWYCGDCRTKHKKAVDA